MSNEPNDKKEHDVFLNYMKDKQQVEENLAKRIKVREDSKKSVRESIVKIISVGSNMINHIFEYLLSTKKNRLILSLLIAVIFYVTVRDEDTTTVRSLGSFPVSVLNLSDEYIVEGIPESVKVYLEGSSAATQLASIKSPTVYIDLKDCNAEGTYEKIPYKISGMNSSVETMILPETVTVTVSKKEERLFDISYSLLNEDKVPSNVVIQKPDLGIDQVKVIGKSTELDKIGTVVCEINVADVTSNTILAGYFKAYDIYGNEMTTVSFEQESIDVVIQTAKGEKLINFKPIFINLPDNMAVSQISYSVKELYFYASSELLADYNEMKIEINLDNLDENGAIYDIPLNIPAGIECSDDNVDVFVTLEAKGTKTFTSVPIEFVCDDDNLTYSSKYTTCTVQFTGANSRLNSLSLEDISCVVTINPDSKGTFNADVVVSCDDSLVDCTILDYPTVEVTVKEKS